LDEKDLEKQLKYADKKQIPYVIIFEGEKLILKDMQKGFRKNYRLNKSSRSLNKNYLNSR